MKPDETVTTSSNPTPPTNPALAEFIANAPKAPVEPTEPKRTIWTLIGSVAGALFSWIVFPISIVLILHFFVFQAYHVVGSSMSPTLSESDYLIVSKVGKTNTGLKQALGHDGKYIPGRGQIIVFHYPRNPNNVFVKRVVGIPGDHIVIKDGSVTIFNSENPKGFNPDTDYEKNGTQTLVDTDETVQPGYVFVLGDNRTPNGSFDSREWGELPSSYIIGNAVLRLLPLDQVRFL